MGGGASKERDLQAELDKARKWAALMQSERDRLANELKNARPRSRSAGRGKGPRNDGDCDRRDRGSAKGKNGKGKGGKDRIR